MIEKILTLISGNIILGQKGLMRQLGSLLERVSSLENSGEKQSQSLKQELSNMTASIQALGEAVKAQPPINIQPPEVTIPKIEIPEIKIPNITVTSPKVEIPEIKLPTINVPPAKVTVTPKIEVLPSPVTFPKEMVVKGFAEAIKAITTSLSSTKQIEKEPVVYTESNPLPVSFIDRSGRRYDLIHLGTPVGGSAGVAPSEITGADKVMRSVSVDISATGTVIPAVSGRRIKVYAIKLTTDAPLSIGFRSGGTTLLEGMQDYLANAGYVDNIQPPAFLFATDPGESLDLVVSGTGNVSGRISYWSDDKI